MPRYRKPSIKNMGLQDFLNTTVAEHNGVDYKLFVKLYDNNVNSANIARLVGKSRQTIINWIEQYKTEREMKAEVTSE